MTENSMTNSLRYLAIIPAAGAGVRMNMAIPKQYLPLAGQSVLQHVVNCFTSSAEVSHTFVVVAENDGRVEMAVKAHPKMTILRCGGESRQQTVENGLRYLEDRGLSHANDWILVHDAARPGLTCELITKLINSVGEHSVGGLLALPVVDTVKRLQNGKVETVSRDGLWLAQTPQMFRFAQLRSALLEAKEVTDEASAIERMGMVPILVEGHLRNRKLTTTDDLIYLETILK